VTRPICHMWKIQEVLGWVGWVVRRKLLTKCLVRLLHSLYILGLGVNCPMVRVVSFSLVNFLPHTSNSQQKVPSSNVVKSTRTWDAQAFCLHDMFYIGVLESS